MTAAPEHKASMDRLDRNLTEFENASVAFDVALAGGEMGLETCETENVQL
jgi:hypothetical protein